MEFLFALVFTYSFNHAHSLIILVEQEKIRDPVSEYLIFYGHSLGDLRNIGIVWINGLGLC